jgi:hypothetical protein
MTAPTPEAFVPVGWSLAGVSGAEARPAGLAVGGEPQGDLTGDGKADRVLILEPSSRVGAGATAACDSCEADNWPRAVVVLESVGAGWMRLGVASWGDASLAARVVAGELVVTWGRSTGEGEALHLARYAASKGRLQLVGTVRTTREVTFDDAPRVERVSEDWRVHERVFERGEPLRFDRKESFTGARTFENGWEEVAR